MYNNKDLQNQIKREIDPNGRRKDKIALITIDVEEDLDKDKGNKKTYCGVEKLDHFMGFLQENNIRCTLFVTGDVLSRYPEKIRKWAERNEIGCHGFRHVSLDQLSQNEREDELDRFIELYSNLLEVKPRGFRAVQNIIDNEQIVLLEKQGFVYDSSVVPAYIPFKKYKGYKGNASKEPYFPSPSNHLAGCKEGTESIIEIPLSPAFLNFPLSGIWLKRLGRCFYKILFSMHKPKFIVLLFHSWNFIGLKKNNFDRRFAESIASFILELKKSYRFMKAVEVADIYKKHE
jgi:hypothetical protein